jgi:hypothetical protein
VKAAERVAEAKIDAARADAQALRELVAELKVQLAEARRPWWRKLIG